MPEVAAVVTRGSMVESRHRADIAVTDAEGQVVWALGNPDMMTYWRSSAKPIQAEAVVLSGAADHFGLTDAEIAVMAASHSGSERHTAAVSSILNKLGLSEDELHCGSHPPMDAAAARVLTSSNSEARQVHCNCSGKHAGLLALSVHLDVPIDSYWELNHLAQLVVLEEVVLFTGCPTQRIVRASDGCGVPVFGLSLAEMATAYARLVSPTKLGSARCEAASRVVRSMMTHPDMVAGNGRLCTDLMTALPGRIVAKGGAEGVYCVGIPELGYGLAVKVEDGNPRALGPIVVAILDRLGITDAVESNRLRYLASIPVYNLHGQQVGSIESALGDVSNMAAENGR